MPTFGIQARRGLVPRSRLACLALSSVLVLAVECAGADGPPAGLSSEAWAGIQKQLEVERHRVVKSDRPGRVWRADNPAQRFTAHFGSEDVALVPRGAGEPAWELGLRLTSWGAAHDLQPVDFAIATTRDNRFEYRRGPLTEWYVNTTMGLKQGFTIEAPPADDINELVLEMTLDGDLTAALAESGQAVTFRHEATNAILTYSGLAAWDAVNASLNARMQLAPDGTRLRLVITVAGTAWPITVDPVFTKVARLLPTPGLSTYDARFGHSVGVDGDVMAACVIDRGSSPYSSSGAVHVFHRDQGGPDAWGHVAKIIPSDGVLYGPVSVSGDMIVAGGSGTAFLFQRNQGGTDAWGQVASVFSVDGVSTGGSNSISGDTAIFGAWHDDVNGEDSGSAYIFQRDQGGPDAWGQVAKITPLDGEAGDWFGMSVSISGDTVIVSAKGDGEYVGAAYVFQRDQGGPDAWGQVQKVVASDGAAHDRFGVSASVDGDTAVVGALDNGGYPMGSAYIYQRDHGGANSWGQVAKIIPDDYGLAADWFGTSVSIDGDTVVVGAFHDDDHGTDSGSAYVFRRDHGGPDAWGKVTKITPNDGAAEDYFGGSVAIYGNTVVVGAIGEDDNDYSWWESGATYVFQRDHGGAGAWGEVAKQDCPPVLSASNAFFGQSVGISGDVAVVGAKYYDNIIQSGAAYVFRRDQGGPDAWGEVTAFIPADVAVGDRFGYSVDVSGDIAVFGTPFDDDNGSDSGSVYIHHRDQSGPSAWGQIAKISPTDGDVDDCFGYSVAIGDDIAVVGAYLDDDNGTDSGSAYVFQRDQGGPDVWGQVLKIFPADAEEGAEFGYSVSISGDTAVVGARNNSIGGAAYIFQRDQNGPDVWGQVARVSAADSASGDEFGFSVSISGNNAIVGAVGDDDYGTDSGSAYVFQRDQGGTGAWGQVAKLIDADGVGGNEFGYSVSLSGETAIVGARDQYGPNGFAHAFSRDEGGPGTWGQVAKITPFGTHGGGSFGESVSISGDTIVIGAPRTGALGDESGSAYIFTISDAFFADGFETGDTSGWSVTVP